jgi:hypothetical protein
VEYYLPHLAVIRPDKVSHRLRIVFDASAKSKGGLSLNDCVEVGDNLYPDMLAILLRFCWNPIAWIGDITKAFLQMELKPEDRSACRILWTKDVANALHSEIVIYQWNRVTFGIASSPFLLTATIRKLLRKFKNKYPETTASILKNTFVDDWVGGASTPESAFTSIKEANIVFEDGRFPIGKWTTNSPGLRALLQRGGLLDPSTNSDAKVLGLKWNTDEDFFHFDPKPLFEASERNDLPLTKRKFLKISAKLFDPVGYLAPLVVRVKMLFQEMWKVKLGWDDPVPAAVAEAWENFMSELNQVKVIKIPRYYFKDVQGSFSSTQVHVFGDASKLAYGSVAYLRVVGQNGVITTRFLASKSRVTPVKGCTMPRLELLAALITARLADYLRSALNLHSWDFYLWTDSTVALAWLTKVNTEQLLPWVRNRVEETASLFPKDVWHHCPGVSNPADVVSRGAAANDLIDNALWWEGPAWLKNKSAWPPEHNDSLGVEEERSYRLEVKKKAAVNIVEVCQRVDLFPWDRYSSLNSLLKTIAWMRRPLRRRVTQDADAQLSEVVETIDTNNGPVPVTMLDGVEIHDAEIVSIRCVQREMFSKEFEALENSSPLPRDSKLLALRPVFDQELKIIRVTGRVSQSFQHLGIKPPILLPSDHHFVVLLINHIHLKIHHSGFKATYAEIKKRFWIVKGRSVVKRIMGMCVICSKLHSRSFQEKAADLPLDRARLAQPFEVVGVDYAGPLFVKAGTIPGIIFSVDSPVEVKAYFLLFTCAATRAVRLELVPDQSTETFILALRRFVAGCNGTVSVMYSDNAKTFRKAANYLSRLQENATVRNFLNGKRIEWRFIASRAPWWGGFWERMVKSTKDLLRKTLQRSSLGWDDLSTLFKEIEMSINNRPLTYSDEEELTPLTPALLISGIRSPIVAEKPAPPVDSQMSAFSAINRREKHRLTLLHRLCSRWYTEYLHDLSRFHYHTKSGRKIQKNDVVLIFDVKTRLNWQMGIVTKLHLGKDGLTRSVDVRTKNGILNRPVQRLYPTEVQVEDDMPIEAPDQPHEEQDVGVAQPGPVPTVAAVPGAATTGESVGTDPGPAQAVPRTTKRGRQVRPRRRLVEEV